MKRGEVWLVNLDPTIGAEIKKTRPCVIVSPNEMSALRTVVVAPLTIQGFDAPSRVQTFFGGKSGMVVLDQVWTVDKRRLVRSLGSLSDDELRAILGTLVEIFAE